MENQSDFSSPEGSTSEQSHGKVMNTEEMEEGCGRRSESGSFDPTASDTSIEQYRRGQELESTVNSCYLSALDWSCLSNKEPLSDEESPKSQLGARRLAVPRRHDAAAGTVAEYEELKLDFPLAALELDPPIAPWPSDLTPAPTTMMTTPVSKTASKAEQFIPDAPLPPQKGMGRQRDRQRDTTQARVFQNVTPISTRKTEYTKPPIPQNFPTQTKTPVLASMMSAALEMATMSKVSPLFEKTETNILFAVQQESASTNCVSSADFTKDAAMSDSSLSTDVGSRGTSGKRFSELNGNDEIPNEGEKMIKQSVKEEMPPYRKRKMATVAQKSADLAPEPESWLCGVKCEEVNKYSSACSVPNQHTEQSVTVIDDVFQKTSTPVGGQKLPNYHLEVLENSIRRISYESSTPKIVPSWRRSDQEVPRVNISLTATDFSSGPFRSENVSDTRDTTADRKRSKTSCTLRPDWVLPLEKKTASKAGKLSRKVSVVNKSKRKLTPYMPGVDSLLIQTDASQSPLEKLAPFTRKCAITPPLYIVHPITGSVKILKQLAQGLKVRCFGINKTNQTPHASVQLMAKFYCEALLMHQKTDSYNLAGYSYGGLVVFEMARLLHQAGKRVGVLIMIDGSPDYVKSHISAIRQGAPADSNPQHVNAVIESHLLLFFIGMYRPMQEPELVQTMLEEQPSQEDRVAAAVGVTLGTVQVSNQARGRWLGLKSKMEKGRQNDKVKVSISHVATDVISLRRQQKALAFLQAASIAEQYQLQREYKFHGDIHLVRIQSMPKLCGSLPLDYNLKKLCTGTVHVQYVDGEHESMMETPHVESVIQAVNLALERVMD